MVIVIVLLGRVVARLAVAVVVIKATTVLMER